MQWCDVHFGCLLINQSTNLTKKERMKKTKTTTKTHRYTTHAQCVDVLRMMIIIDDGDWEWKYFFFRSKKTTILTTPKTTTTTGEGNLVRVFPIRQHSKQKQKCPNKQHATTTEKYWIMFGQWWCGFFLCLTLPYFLFASCMFFVRRLVDLVLQQFSLFKKFFIPKRNRKKNACFFFSIQIWMAGFEIQSVRVKRETNDYWMKKNEIMCSLSISMATIIIIITFFPCFNNFVTLFFGWSIDWLINVRGKKLILMAYRWYKQTTTTSKQAENYEWKRMMIV